MRRAVWRAASALAVLTLVACKQERAETPPPPVRPVLSVVVRPGADRPVGFAGTIQPQYQTDLGFRVLGRMIARNVDVGDIVKAGDTLAQLDPLAYELAVRASEADVAKVRSQLSTSAAAEGRSGYLLGRQVLPQADFDSAKQARESAAASVQQAAADLDKARERLSYTTLKSETDGAVTSIETEVGQTVAAGKKVMTVARLDSREAVVDLPEDAMRSLTVGAPFIVVLQADPSITASGKVREIAPQADASTRTHRVRITLDRFAEAFRLGATITARTEAPAETALEIPQSALLERDGAVRVWIVDPKAKTVGTVPVEVAARDGGRARIANGLAPGARVVVAGVHSLSEGQAVKLDAKETN